MGNVADYSRMGVNNPFDAPVYYIEETDTTMSDARLLAERGEPDGTVIFSSVQNSGRGRVPERVWESSSHKSLLCTVLFRRKIDALPLKAGLAVARTYARLLPVKDEISVKWPNDVLFLGKKLAGILCESDGSTLFVGAGLNLSQKSFPAHLEDRATSLTLARETFSEKSVFSPLPLPQDLLEIYLTELSVTLNDPLWNDKLSALLWKKNETIRFIAGNPDSGEVIKGRAVGIGTSGEFIIDTGTIEQPKHQSFFSGEISWDL